MHTLTFLKDNHGLVQLLKDPSRGDLKGWNAREEKLLSDNKLIYNLEHQDQSNVHQSVAGLPIGLSLNNGNFYLRLTSTSILLPQENAVMGILEATQVDRIFAIPQSSDLYHSSIQLLDNFHAAASNNIEHLRDNVWRKFESSNHSVVRTSSAGVSTDVELTIYQVAPKTSESKSMQISWKNDSGEEISFNLVSKDTGLSKVCVIARITRLWSDVGQTRYMIEGLIIDNISAFDRDDYALKSYLLETIDVSICITSMQGVVRYWNQGATALYGYTKDEMIGNDITKVMVPEAAASMSAEIMSNLNKGQSWTGSWFCPRKDGILVSVRVTDIPIRDLNGDPIGILGVSSDNTLFEETMQKLSYMRDHLELIVSQRAGELEAANVLLRNEVAERKRIQADLELMALALRKTATSVAIVDANWNITWMNDSLSRTTGLHSSLNANLLDLIIEQTGNNVSKIIVQDRDTALLDSKKPQLTITGVPHSLLLQSTANNTPKPFPCVVNYGVPDGESILDLLRDAITNNQPIEAEVMLRTNNATNPWTWHILDSTPIENGNDGSQMAVVVLQDIGRLKSSEQITLEASRMKTEFITSMSHELRTPLNGILGATSTLHHWLEACQGNTASLNLPELHGSMSIVMSSSQLLLNLINNVLYIQKIEANRMDLSLSSVSLLAMLSKAVRVVLPIAQIKGIELYINFGSELMTFQPPRQGETCFDGELIMKDDSGVIMVGMVPLKSSCCHGIHAMPIPDSIITDGPKLVQICINLLANAIKYSPDSTSVRLTVESRIISNVPHLIITVADQGHGIPLNKRQCLFKRFSQISADSHESQSGSGLGLSICRNLISLLGGAIWIQSQEPECIRQNSNGGQIGGCALCDAELLSRSTNHCLLEDAERGFTGASFSFMIPCNVDLAAASAASHSNVGGTNMVGANISRVATATAVEGLYAMEGIRRLVSVKNLLVVDDDSINRKVLFTILSQIFHHAQVPVSISTANNGIEALEAMNKESFDVVFMDVLMPLMDGLTAGCKYIEDNPEPSSRPILIALTANALANDVESTFAAGLDMHLTKPVTLNKMKKVFNVLGLEVV